MKNNNGYIALISVMILGAILITLSASLSVVTFGQTSSGLDSINKESSYFLALSCFDHALLKLSQDASYSGNEVYIIGTDQCKVDSVAPGPSGGFDKFVIISSASSGASTTTLMAMVNATTLETVSFEEK